jgi:hypothetical protein
VYGLAELVQQYPRLRRIAFLDGSLAQLANFVFRSSSKHYAGDEARKV